MRPRRLLKQFAKPPFAKAEYRVLIEPVNGGAYVQVLNTTGDVLERCVVPVSPHPEWFPFRIVRWGVVCLRNVLRVHFTPEGGWEALEAQRDEKRVRPQIPVPE